MSGRERGLEGRMCCHVWSRVVLFGVGRVQKYSTHVVAAFAKCFRLFVCESVCLCAFLLYIFFILHK